MMSSLYLICVQVSEINSQNVRKHDLYIFIARVWQHSNFQTVFIIYLQGEYIEKR